MFESDYNWHIADNISFPNLDNFVSIMRAQDIFLNLVSQSSHELLIEAASLLSNEIEDRLIEIFSPKNPYQEEGEDEYLPPLQSGSIKHFLLFCHRVGHDLDDRFLPARDADGELGLQFYHPERGLLAIDFRADGETILAWKNESGYGGSCRCLAVDLLSSKDPVVVERWFK